MEPAQSGKGELMNLVQLTRKDHGHLRLDPGKAAAAAANVHLVPVVRSEIRKVASQFPVFFAKDGETGDARHGFLQHFHALGAEFGPIL